MTLCQGCTDPRCEKACRYPYRHHGPAVHGSKTLDYLVSEISLREDRPEMFDEETT